MRCLAYRRVVSLVTNASSGRAGTPNSGGVCPTTLLTIARFEPRRLERWLVERVGETHPRGHSPRPDQSTAGAAGELSLPRRRRASLRGFPQQPRGASRVGAAYLPASTGYRAHEPPDGRPVIRRSDFVTLRELHALEVYDSVLRPFDLNHCLTARFFGASRVYDLSCARDSVDFEHRDLLLLEVVATVLGMAVEVSAATRPRTALATRHYRAGSARPRSCPRGRPNAEIASELRLLPVRSRSISTTSSRSSEFAIGSQRRVSGSLRRQVRARRISGSCARM